MGNGELVERFCMLRGIQDYLAGSLRRNGAIEIRTDRIRLRRVVAQRGEIVIVLVYVVAVGNLPRSRTKGAPVLRHLGPVLPMGGDHGPGAQQRVVTQFRHLILHL